MGKSSWWSGGSLEADILRWMAIGGGSDRDGNLIRKPLSLAQAQMIDTLCEKYGKLPSEIFAEDVGIIKINQIVNLGRKDNGEHS